MSRTEREKHYSTNDGKRRQHDTWDTTSADVRRSTTIDSAKTTVLSAQMYPLWQDTSETSEYITVHYDGHNPHTSEKRVHQIENYDGSYVNVKMNIPRLTPHKAAPVRRSSTHSQSQLQMELSLHVPVALVDTVTGPYSQ